MSSEKAAQINRLQEQLKVVMAERQRLELEIKETDRVVNEVKSLAEGTEVYRSTGPVLYKTTSQEVLTSLQKYREEVNERLTLYQTQENAIRSEMERIRKSTVIKPSAQTEEES
ncbi:MAG: prefoldin subunit [Thermoprotei archaeon]